MLRIAAPGDAERIAEIYRPYVEKTAISFEEEAPGTEAMAAKIAKVGSTFPFIVFEEEIDGKPRIQGYAYATRYRERAAYRWSLEDSVYVAEEARGRGVGKALLSTLVELLRELGYMKVYAVITPPNPASVSLHAVLGFEPLCRFSDTAYKLGAWQSVDWMELALGKIPAVPRDPLSFPSFAAADPEGLAEILAGRLQGKASR